VPLMNARIGWHTYLRELTAADLIASSEALAGPRDAVLRPGTDDFWQPAALPATLEIDFGRMVDIDYVGLLGNLGSARCGVDLHTSLDAGVWTLFSDSVAPADDRARMFLDAKRAVRSLRLSIGGNGIGAIPPRIQVTYAGEVLAMETPILAPHTPIVLSRDTVRNSPRSRGGQLLGTTIRRHGLVGSVQFKNLSEAFVRGPFDLFVKSARRFPFFFGWMMDRFPTEVAYVEAEDDIAPSYMTDIPLMQASWKMKGVGHD
jgi:hypothetical protein